MTQRHQHEAPVTCETCGEAGSPDEHACVECGLPTPFRGSGWGPFTPGEKISAFSEIRADTLLLDESTQFHARNVMRVTRVVPERNLMYCVFVNPKNPARPRGSGDREFCVHEFEVEKDGSWDRKIHRANSEGRTS